MISDKQDSFLQTLFNSKTQKFLSKKANTLAQMKKDNKGKKFTNSVVKRTTRISILGENEEFGALECIVNCPYCITNVKCISLKGTVLTINKDNLFGKIPRTNEKLLEIARQKIDFLEFRISNQSQVHQARLDPRYTKNYITFNEENIDTEESSVVSSSYSIKSSIR